MDIYNLLAHMLWITALALATSALSYARWEAIVQQQKYWMAIKTGRWLITLSLAGLLFCSGRAALAEGFWMRAVWLVLVVAFATLATMLWINRERLP